ncbi:MAG: M67 family metallopeptidase [Sphingomonadales bacterium]|nr:M67 family metallopeptidase [Sphingomonadales bacterium]
MDLEVTSGVNATLLKEAASAWPEECCGLLMGEGARIESTIPARNVHPDPASHFEIDPAVLIAAHRAARQGGPQVLGYYHSHPNGRSTPSPEDQACAERQGRIWAIIAGGEVLWWRDETDRFEPLPTRVVAR